MYIFNKPSQRRRLICIFSQSNVAAVAFDNVKSFKQFASHEVFYFTMKKGNFSFSSAS